MYALHPTIMVEPERQLGLTKHLDHRLDRHAFEIPPRIERDAANVELGHDDLSRKHIEMARTLGAGLTDAERFWRRIAPNSPRLESAVGTIPALYAAREPCA